MLGEVGVVPGVSGLEGVRIWDGQGVLKVRVRKDDLGVVSGRVGRVVKSVGMEGLVVDVIRER